MSSSLRSEMYILRVCQSCSITHNYTLSRIHMVITRVCLQNISLLQNSPHHGDQTDMPSKWREPVARCWPVGGRVATESKSGSSPTTHWHSAAGRDAHWGWVSSWGSHHLKYSKNTWKYYWNTWKYNWNTWKYSKNTWKWMFSNDTSPEISGGKSSGSR